jgi:hypothetical protein
VIDTFFIESSPFGSNLRKKPHDLLSYLCVLTQENKAYKGIRAHSYYTHCSISFLMATRNKSRDAVLSLALAIALSSDASPHQPLLKYPSVLDNVNRYSGVYTTPPLMRLSKPGYLAYNRPVYDHCLNSTWPMPSHQEADTERAWALHLTYSFHT